VRAVVAVVICAVVAVPAAASASATARGPLRDAARLSGLRVRHAVPTAALSAARYDALWSRAWQRTVPATLRRAEATAYKQLGLSGSVTAPPSRAWYDVRTHRLFVQRKPAAGRRALINEYVRALIDQNFGLKRLVALRARDRDRWYAAQAMVDGTAALASGLPTPGRALAAELRYLGGRAALASALRTFPQTTEQLLHVDKFLERERALPVRLPARAGGVALSSSETFGELDVRSLLQAFGLRDAAIVGAGWGGGRLALYGDVAALVLRWDTPEDAAEWQAAVPRYVAAAFPGSAARTCPPLDGCWGDVAAGVYGTTSVLASGPASAQVAAALLTTD
jgi:hypothetical protein